MSFADKTLTCRDCGQEFIWTAGEQEFYASRGLQNPPSRCPADRAAWWWIWRRGLRRPRDVHRNMQQLWQGSPRAVPAAW